MTEDQLMALIGRLYVALQLKDNELRRLNGLVNEYERAARTVVDDEVDDGNPEETA